MEEGKPEVASSINPSDDEEKQLDIQTIKASKENNTDFELVTWESETDPSNPLNWSTPRKWCITLLSSLGGLVTLMSGSMMAPAQVQIGQDLSISEAEAQMALSIFVLAFAVGPLVTAPLSEVYGRRPVWIYGGIWYIIWNTACGFVRTNWLIIVARLMAGLGASGEYAISMPILSDTWRAEERGKSFAIATFLPLLGPALGPIIGGLVTGGIGWPWLFWVVSIYDAVLILGGIFLFHESSAPIILARKAKHLNKTTGGQRHYATAFERSAPTLKKKLFISLSRPIRLLVTQPVLQVMALYLAYNFGVLYITLSTFATLWTRDYHQPVSSSGLHYIALAVGYTIAAQIGGPMTDRVWAHLKKKKGGTTAPEYRIPLMMPGAVLILIGLFWFGWAAEYRVFWLVTDLGVSVYGCGTILMGQAMQAYVLDSCPEYTASATAASQLLRGFAAFGFPIFAPVMYASLGNGWGNSLLGFVFLGIGVPAPLLLWKFGARLRAKGTPQF